MSRARNMLENFSDVIDSMARQMDDFASSVGGYMNRPKNQVGERYYFDKDKFTSRKGGKKKSRKNRN